MIGHQSHATTLGQIIIMLGEEARIAAPTGWDRRVGVRTMRMKTMISTGKVDP